MHRIMKGIIVYDAIRGGKKYLSCVSDSQNLIFMRVSVETKRQSVVIMLAIAATIDEP